MHFIRKIIFIGSIVIALLFSLTPVRSISSEYYKYKDKNGIVCFTDDLSEVPRDQRESIIFFKSLKSNVKSSSLNKGDTDSFDKLIEKPVSDKNDTDTLDGKLLKASEALQEERIQLEQILDSLQKRRADLADKLIKNKTFEEKEPYRKIANQFNIDVKQYEKRYKKYSRSLQVYNENVQKTSSSKSQAE